MLGYVVLVASVIIQICLGGIYAWSEFVPALTTDYHLSQAQAQLVFGVNIAVFTFSMIFAGRLQDKYGPRPVAAIGGILFSIGYIIASLSEGHFLPIFLGIAVIAGAGIGFTYVCPIATCIKWFPNRKGLVSGLAVAGFGGGAVLLSALAGIMFSTGKDVLEVFRFIGCVYGAAIIICAFILTNPKGFAKCEPKHLLPFSTILNDKAFWRLTVGMFTGTFAGLLVIGNLKPIGLASGVSDIAATAAISSFAIGNAMGRISWGAITDRFCWRAIPVSLSFLALTVAALLFNFHIGWIFILISALVGFGFGACFVVYMSQTVNIYGAERLGSVYPLIFFAYGISGILGPTAGGWLYDISATFSVAIITAAAVAAIGAIGYSLLRR